jgi:hypothetical protein
MECIIEYDSSDERESNETFSEVVSVPSVVSSITKSSDNDQLDILSISSAVSSISYLSIDVSTNTKTERNQRNCRDRVYAMLPPVGRIEIIRQIDAGLLSSECESGRKQKWWTNKHYPKKPIPTNIYLLGYGTQRELHEKYIREYGPIEWKEFSSYTRELIKQGIMY